MPAPLPPAPSAARALAPYGLSAVEADLRWQTGISHG